MKKELTTDDIARMLAEEKGEDYDQIPFWKQIKYNVEARRMVKVFKRLLNGD